MVMPKSWKLKRVFTQSLKLNGCVETQAARTTLAKKNFFNKKKENYC